MSNLLMLSQNDDLRDFSSFTVQHRLRPDLCLKWSYESVAFIHFRPGHLLR